MNRKRGRPKKDITKDYIFACRLTKEDNDKLEYLAKKMGVSKSKVLLDGLDILMNNET